MPEQVVQKPEIIEQNGQKLALVSTIKTATANREFQKNVELVQKQREIAIDLNKRIEQAVTPGEKEALRKQLDEVVKSLNSNNELMLKTYGFSLHRNYVVAFVSTRLYTPLTDEEFEKIPAEEKAKPDVIKSIEGKVHMYIAAINDVESNDRFRQNVQLVQIQRNRLIQLKDALDKTTAAEAKAPLQEEFNKLEELLKKNNEEMTKIYGFTLMRNYLVEVDEARLYTVLTPDDIKRIEEGTAATPAA